MLPDGLIGFEIGSYDSGRALVIDPIISYSTYLGGTGEDSNSDLATDGTGYVFVAGRTGSTDFPTTAGALQGASAGGYDISISKLSQDGSSLVFSTFLGGSGYEGSPRIALDSTGNVYVVGLSTSSELGWHETSSWD